MSLLRNMIAANSNADADQDPYWANVVSLLHFDGADASTTFTDQVSGRTWTGGAAAQLDTAQAKFGASSMLCQTTGYITSNTSAGDAFGTGDFTLEWFQRATTATSLALVLDSRTLSSEAKPAVYVQSGNLNYYVLGGSRIAMAITLNTWQHIAICRASGTTRMFVAGTAGTPWADSTNYTNSFFRLGDSSYSVGTPFSGHIDEFRATKGVARYTSNFTPPPAAFSDG